MRALQQADIRLKLLVMIVLVVVVFHLDRLASLGACLIVSLLAAALARVRLATLARSISPLVAILVVTVVMQVVASGPGAALVQAGPLVVTEEALVSSAVMMMRLLCLILLNLAFMRCCTAEELVSAFAWMVRPLERLGLRCDAFILAMSVAFRFIPVLADDFTALKAALQSRGGEFDTGGLRVRAAAYARLFPALLRSSLRRANALAEALLSRCL